MIARSTRAAAIVAIALVATMAERIGAQQPRAVPSRPVSIDLSKEKVGTEPTRFVPIVGDWIIAQDEGKKVVMVDGRKWKRGQPAGDGMPDCLPWSSDGNAEGRRKLLIFLARPSASARTGGGNSD